jgi:hypothetical protein
MMTIVKKKLIRLALVCLYGAGLFEFGQLLGLDHDGTAVVMGGGLMALAIAEIVRDAVLAQVAKRHPVARERG